MKRWMMLVVLLLPVATLAKNVDLSTVPPRASIQLTIYNSEDLTLVRETRAVTFKKGANPLQFSWANTLIDPTSVELRFLSSADKLSVVDTTFPHDKPQMLYWNVQSDFDGQATIEITYFTSGISWTADYVALADKAEEKLGLEGFVRVHNNSGEEYENAQVRLVVGTINLVEKIAQLAQIPMRDVATLSKETRQDMKLKVQFQSIDRFDDGAKEDAAAAKQVIKEGLSEYFIYTIEGTETIKNGWSKRLRSFEGQSVPFKIQYRYRPAQYGDGLVRMYLLTNDTNSKLGTTPLPDGIVRVFRDNGRGGLSYLTAQSIKYVAIGDKIELNLGADPNVIFELIKLKANRDNIWNHIDGTDVFKQVGAANVQVEVNSHVVGWDDHALFTQRIRNYTAKPIEVEIRRSFAGHILFRSELNPLLHDFRTVQFTATIEPGKRSDSYFEIVTQQGRNAKQNNVTLEKSKPAP